ncbi:MAG: alpha/beta hydrolase family protein, partial [Acidimicrobiales bacterium]
DSHRASAQRRLALAQRRQAVLRRRRFATGLTMAVVAVVAAVVVAHLGHSPRKPLSDPTVPSGGTAPPAATTLVPTTTSTTVPPQPNAIGSIQLTFQRSATTGPLSVRQIPTIVRYPAVTSGPGGTAVADRAGGPYPLLVFSQGFGYPAEGYAALLNSWTSDGYVVADPTYPYTYPDVSNEADIVHHPADLRSVISDLLQMSTQTGSTLSGLINPQEIGVVGQSDGGDVSLAVAAAPCCRDPRVKAAAVLSGAEASVFAGTYYSAGSVPLLVVQGSADTINPPVCSTTLYDQAPPPRYFLSLFGAQHLPPYVDAGPDQTLVEEVTRQFFDGYLKGQPAELAAIPGTGDVSGVAAVAVGAAVPPAPGACPQAP